MNRFFFAAVFGLALPFSAQSFADNSQFHLIATSSFDFFAPVVTSTSAVGEKPVGSIIYDVSTNQFKGLDTSGNWDAMTAGSGSYPRSSIFLTNPSGYGSTGNSIRTWGSNTVTGSTMTYTSDSVNGDYITINTTGLYSISYQDGSYNGTTSIYGISRNAASNTSCIYNISDTTNLALIGDAGTFSALNTGAISVTLLLNSGDVIRAHTGTGTAGSCSDKPDQTNYLSKFRITQINN